MKLENSWGSAGSFSHSLGPFSHSLGPFSHSLGPFSHSLARRACIGKNWAEDARAYNEVPCVF